MNTHITLRQHIPGLNGPDGLIREHFHAKKKRLQNIQNEIMANTRNQHPGKVHVIYTRFTCQPMDWDNHCASFKLVGDALKAAKIIKDDNPKILVKFEPRQVKVATRQEEIITVTIICIN